MNIANDTRNEEEKDSFDLLSVLVTVDKREEIEVLGDAEDVELIKMTAEKDASVKEV